MFGMVRKTSEAVRSGLKTVCALLANNGHKVLALMTDNGTEYDSVSQGGKTVMEGLNARGGR